MKVFDSMKATGKCALSYEEFTTIMKSKMVKEQGEATPGNAFAPTNGIFIAQYDEEKRKEMLRFLNSRGMALWTEEEGLHDIIILDPIEYFVRPATSIICKHIATKDDPYVTKHEIPEIHGKRKKTHVFLSHDWGIDDRNHRRVKYISEALKMRGFIPWIDDERLVNVVDERIVDGMDHTEVLLIFLTENYQKKVNGQNSQDYCQREFLYGMDKLRKERTIVVVLDSSLTDTSRWTGLFRFNLTGVLYQNLSNVFREDGEEVTISEEEVNGKIDGLCEVIERVRSENTPRDDV
eukprot:gene7341-biopygen1352